MELWLILVLYMAGLALIVAETFIPGLIIGLVGSGLIAVSVIFGFRHHWALGAGQIVLTVLVAPAAFVAGIRRMSLKSTLEGGATFTSDYAALAGKAGEALTDLRPGGVAALDGRRVDVVTNGELVPRGAPVTVIKVEGNRVVVRAADKVRESA